MSRKLISLCLLLAVCGCSDATKKGPVTEKRDPASLKDSVVANEVPPIATSKNAEPVAVKPMENEPSEHVAAEAKPAEVQPKEATKPKEESEKGLTTEEAFAEAQTLFQKDKENIAGVIEVLERALPGNPDDFRLLFSLAQLNSTLASSPDPTHPDFEKHRKAAEYLRRGLRANPAIAGNPSARTLATGIYYNEACAFSVDNKPEQALKSLEEAVSLGFNNLAEMDKDQDLENVRAFSGYADFKTKIEGIIREQAELARMQSEKEIDNLLANNKPFDFNFELTDTDAKPITKAEFAGKVLIVDIWGTWCPPCRAEIPHFVKLQKTYEEAGLVIVGLNQENADDQEAAVKLIQDFREQNGMNYRCALLNDETIAQVPEFRGFPTTIFFDRTGKVRGKVVGLHDYEYLERIVRKLLDEKVDGAEAANTSDK